MRLRHPVQCTFITNVKGGSYVCIIHTFTLLKYEYDTPKCKKMFTVEFVRRVTSVSQWRVYKWWRGRGEGYVCMIYTSINLQKTNGIHDRSWVSAEECRSQMIASVQVVGGMGGCSYICMMQSQNSQSLHATHIYYRCEGEFICILWYIHPQNSKMSLTKYDTNIHSQLNSRGGMPVSADGESASGGVGVRGGGVRKSYSRCV